MTAIGLGVTDPPVDAGVLALEEARVPLPVEITIGGLALASEDVLDATLIKGEASLYRVKVRIPQQIAAGQQAVILKVGGHEAPANGYLTVTGN